MKIFRYLFLSGSIMLLATACQDTEETVLNTIPTEGLRASIVDEEAVTRSIVVDNPGIKLESFWTANDKIGVFSSQATNIQLSIDSATISTTGKEATFDAIGGVPSGELLVYHPYMAGAGMSNQVLQLTFPSVQHYTMMGRVPQPDPEACVMVGKGSKGTGVAFKNVMAVLKIGQVFTQQTTIKSIEFRDLSGKAVSGSYTVDLSQGAPVTEFTGDGKVIKLDLGNGLDVGDGGRLIAFMVVPARQYAKGFELTFVDANGQQTVRTVGSKSGKKLNRSVVHPVGDFGDYSDIPGMSYQLKPTAQLMTPDKLDLITITRDAKYYVKDDEGNNIYIDEYGQVPLFLPHLEMYVHKDLNPQEGGWLIFNTPSDDLPQGGIYKITKCTPSPDGNYFTVSTRPETDFAKPFEQLTIGTPLFDSQGNLTEDGGVELDISSYVKEIVEMDENRNIIKRMPQHPVPTYDMNAAERITRAPRALTYEPPALTISMEDGQCACEVTTNTYLTMRLAIGVIGGELQYIYTTCNPKFKMNTSFSLAVGGEKEVRQHIMTFLITGIPIGPIVVLPEISFEGVVGIGGELKFSASKTFNYNLGTYGLAYNKGDGLTFRHSDAPPPDKDDNFDPKLGANLVGSLYAYGGIGMKAGVSIYALCSLGANTDFKLKLASEFEPLMGNIYSSGATKLKLTPEIDISPYTAIIGGRLSKLWKGLGAKIECDPLWERYLTPWPKETNYNTNLNYKTQSLEITGVTYTNWGVPSSLQNVEYDIALTKKTLTDCDIALTLTESDGLWYRWSGERISYDSENVSGAISADDYEVTYDEFKSYNYPILWWVGRTKGIVGLDGDNSRQTNEYIKIGTYPAGVDSLRLKGSCTFSSPKPGKFYQVRAVLLDRAGKTTNLLSDESVGQYNHFFGKDIFGFE